jgi:hypothetical protein
MFWLSLIGVVGLVIIIFELGLAISQLGDIDRKLAKQIDQLDTMLVYERTRR